MIRSWIIQAFVHQRLGWVALVLALLSLPTRSHWIAAIALFIACAGLILYTTELCAPAALLALIVIVREGQTTAQANSMSNTP
jgi:membrane-bound ClpP family serine protease